MTDYGDVSAISLLCENLTAAKDFVARELGPTATPTAPMAALRDTVLRYLEHERSISKVAEEMHIARGTVVYRVRKVEELLEHDISHRRFELHAALLLAHMLGEVVLSGGRDE